MQVTDHARQRMQQRLRISKEGQIRELLNKFEKHCIKQYTSDNGMVTKKVKWNGRFVEGVFSGDRLVTVWVLLQSQGKPSYRNKHVNNQRKWARSRKYS